MESDLHKQFLEELERKYGPRNLLTSKFGTSSYGVIAKDLCISASQFSKLISGTATEGMYMRSIANIAQLLKIDRLEAEKRELLAGRARLSEELAQARPDIHKKVRQKAMAYGLIAFLAGSALAYFWGFNGKQEAVKLAHPLARYFDRDFNSPYDSPYLDETEVQDYCPCSAYEGTWSLNEEYKLPLPGNKRPGV